MIVIKTMKNQIEVDKELFTALSECRSIDETRFFMTQAYYDKAKNRISATDGRRVFVYNFTEENELTEGFYIPVKQGKNFYLFHKEDMEGQYPNIDRVIPEYELKTDYEFCFCSNLSNNSRPAYLLTMITGPVNLSFLKPVYGIAVYCSYCLDFRKAFILSDKSKNWQYVIMPMEGMDREPEIESIHRSKFIAD